MADGDIGPLGPEDDSGRLSSRVHRSATALQGNPNNSYPIRASQSFGTSSRSSGSSGKGSGSSDPRFDAGFLLDILFNNQEVGRLASNHQLETPQPIHPPCPISYGNPEVDSSVHTGRFLGCHNRLEGRLPSCPRPPVISKMATVQDRRPVIRVSGSSLRPVHVTTGVHPNCQGGGGVPQVQRVHCLRLPRRLPYPSGVQRGSVKRSGRGPRPSLGVGIPYQRGKVLPRPVATGTVSRSHTRPRLRHGHTYSRQSSGGVHLCGTGDVQSGSRGGIVNAPPRTYSEPSGLGSMVSPPYEADTTPLSISLQTLGSPSPSSGSDPGVVARRARMVVRTPAFAGRDSIPSTTSDFGPHDGRIKDGMGCPPGEVPPSRRLVSPTEKVPHQSLGDVGNISGLEQNSAHCSWSPSSRSHRQRDGGVLPDEAGRHSQSVALRSGLAPTVLVRGQINLSDRRVSPRGGEHSRGCTVQRGTSVHQASSVEGVVGRVASPPGGLPDRLLPSRTPSSRSVCVQTQPAAPELLFLGGGPGIMGKERPGSELGRAPCICLPSNSIDSEGPLQVDSVDRLSHVASGPSLATAGMVCSASGPFSIRTGPPSNLSRPSCVIGSRGVGPASNYSDPSADGLDDFRKSFREAGLSRQASDIALQARRTSTRRTYSARFKRFSVWCRRTKINPYTASVAQVADFLSEVFTGGAQARTVQGYRAAIGAVHHGLPGGFTMSSSPILTQLIKGMFHLRPPVRRLIPAWDLPLVLQFLATPGMRGSS